MASLADWDADGGGDPWFGAGIRTADEADEARERVERLAGGGVDDTARTLADVFRGIQLPDAPTTDDWGHVLATVGEVRDTLEVFRPDVFDIPLDDLVTATGSSAYRRSVGSQLGWLDRWRVRRQARALLRPGRPPADLHAALAPRASSGWPGASSPARVAGPRSRSTSTAPARPTPASSPTCPGSTTTCPAPTPRGPPPRRMPSRASSTSTSSRCAPASTRSRPPRGGSAWCRR